jgi:uncharacterized protein (TIGR03435 family)
MKRGLLYLTAVLALMVPALRAQDIAGNWQGTLKTPEKDFRIILVVTKDDGKLKATMYSIDQAPQPIKASSVSLDGSTFKCAVDIIGLTYEGKLSADGTTIDGSWSQGQSIPLVLTKATKTTAWAVPAPPPPPRLMPATADPSFDVATIKPNDSGATSMRQLSVSGRNFRTNASSLADLIAFSYQVQAKQIVGAPDWIEKDRYDIAAVPDVEGAPNPAQLRSMVRKLLADRFQLKFHHDQREMSAFVLTVGKSGQKLKPTESTGPLPGLGAIPANGGISLMGVNATLGDFTGLLQSLVLDRPVVDRTGIPGKFDLTVTFLPDDTQFNGHSPVGKLAEGVEPAPSLSEALLAQLGLKLTPEKTAVDVLAIDHVEKPSAN